MAEKSENRGKMRNLRKKSKYHDNELKKLHKDESKILKTEGFEERSHVLIWLFIIVAIIVAVVWFFILGPI